MASEVDTLLRTIKQGQYHTLIFDLDQTITHLQLPWREWRERVLKEFSPEEREHIRRQRRATSWAAIINDYTQRDEDLGQKIIAITRGFESSHPDHIPYEALIAALPGLKQAGYRLVLWTNNTRQTAERVLGELGIRNLFSKLATRDDTHFMKPHLAGWQLLKEPDKPSSSYLYIGDSLNDQLAARSAGIDFFQIKHFRQKHRH